jgi:hypothetical protein
VKPWTAGPVIRLQIGLEDVADLIEDLERGFAAAANRVVPKTSSRPEA